jgi:hypothetical protein
MSQFPPPPNPPPNPFGEVPPGPPPGYPNPYQPSPYHLQYRPSGPDPALGFIIPVGQSVWAVIAGYLGLLSLGICFLGPLAVLCGAVGIIDINKHPGRGGMFRCVVGIVLGLIGSIGLVILIVSLSMDGRR